MNKTVLELVNEATAWEAVNGLGGRVLLSGKVDDGWWEVSYYDEDQEMDEESRQDLQVRILEDTFQGRVFAEVRDPKDHTVSVLIEAQGRFLAHCLTW